MKQLLLIISISLFLFNCERIEPKPPDFTKCYITGCSNQNAFIYIENNNTQFNANEKCSILIPYLPYTLDITVYYNYNYYVPFLIEFGNIGTRVDKIISYNNAVVKYKVTLTENDVKINTY